MTGQVAAADAAVAPDDSWRPSHPSVGEEVHSASPAPHSDDSC